MHHISATDAKRNLAALLDSAQREPVMIHRRGHIVAVLLSAKEYERQRTLNVAVFQEFCDGVAARAASRGLDAAELAGLLREP